MWNPEMHQVFWLSEQGNARVLSAVTKDIGMVGPVTVKSNTTLQVCPLQPSSPAAHSSISFNHLRPGLSPFMLLTAGMDHRALLCLWTITGKQLIAPKYTKVNSEFPHGQGLYLSTHDVCRAVLSKCSLTLNKLKLTRKRVILVCETNEKASGV